MNNAIFTFLVGLVTSGIFAWPILALLIRMRSRQTVSQFVQEHAHKQGTPTMGGLIILVGFLAVITSCYGSYPLLALKLLAFTVGFAAIGFVDDFVVPRLYPGTRGLGWGQKLALEFLVAGLTVYPFTANPSPLSLGLTVVTVLFFANAYNFADGLDWLAGSILFAFGAGVIGLAKLDPANPAVWLVSGLLGAAVPFMVLNRPKAKVFMGDVGSMPIGAVLGLLCAWLVWPPVAPELGQESFHGVGWLPVVVLSLVLAVELIPVPLQIASVKLRKKRLFPMTPIHHAYQRAGMKETRIVAWFFGAQVLCSLLAVALGRAR
jgi:phospho-N-acetylmuramoyl-pentapeptide-transferase